MIIKSSIKYPIIFMSGYLAIQMFLLSNFVLYATLPVAKGGLGQPENWAFNVYAVVWALQAILAIFVIKWFAKWGYKEGLVVSMMFQAVGFFLVSIPTVPFFIIGACCWGAGASLSVSQNYVVLSDTMSPEHKGRNNIFLLLYAIMNAAAFIAMIISGLSSAIGFSNIFRISAILAVVLFFFLLFIYNPNVEAVEGTICDEQNRRAKKEKVTGFLRLVIVGIVVALIMIGFCFIAEIANALVTISVIGIFVYLVYLIFTHNGDERAKILTFTILMLISIVFWVGYNLYAATGFVSVLSKATNRAGIPVQDYLSVDALTIIVIGLPVVILLIALEKKGFHLNAAMRIMVGLALLGVAFCVPVIGFHASGFGRIDGFWMIITIFVCALGEICIGPVGAAVAGHCCTKKLAGIFMAFTFVIVSGSAPISTYWAEWMVASKSNAITDVTHQFSYTIGMFAILCFVCAIIVLVLYKKLVKWGHFTSFTEKEEVPQIDGPT